MFEIKSKQNRCLSNGSISRALICLKIFLFKELRFQQIRSPRPKKDEPMLPIAGNEFFVGRLGDCVY